MLTVPGEPGNHRPLPGITISYWWFGLSRSLEDHTRDESGYWGPLTRSPESVCANLELTLGYEPTMAHTPVEYGESVMEVDPAQGVFFESCSAANKKRNS